MTPSIHATPLSARVMLSGDSTALPRLKYMATFSYKVEASREEVYNGRNYEIAVVPNFELLDVR